ncbi:hypothetical protein ColLi_07182 [Colletotrichum liriopes]|uniref:Intradiol ring-cleavage dioxygenases domain-containing protein n=1 Tax=Colletotrichum liriopes TaxID=708192 RepID=A0AA37GNK7_9PEZI|nr:hypothetical protein ColLi_07182 [Colletotrichum liriopes]
MAAEVIETPRAHNHSSRNKRNHESLKCATTSAVRFMFLGIASLISFSIASLLTPVSALGTAKLASEIAARQDCSINNAMNLAHCNHKLKQRGILDQAIVRRVGKYGYSSSLTHRDVDTILNTDHEITDGSVNWYSSDAEIFATRDDGCVLSMETTEGPFYTNSTGVYSGVVSSANGAGGADPSNAFNTFHRGLQKTNAEGAVWFGSNLPGHYSGRTPHIHIMTHAVGTTALANDTIQNNIATHAGQLFFDQKLVDSVRTHERYAGNGQAFIENKQDPYFHREADFTDPVLSYVLLDHEGRDIEKGVMAWKLVGVNMTNVREIVVANRPEG